MNTTAQLIKHFEGIYIWNVIIKRMEGVEEALLSPISKVQSALPWITVSLSI